MSETIKRIGVSDLGKLAVIFENDFIKKFSICAGDKIDIDDFLLIDGESNGK